MFGSGSSLSRRYDAAKQIRRRYALTHSDDVRSMLIKQAIDIVLDGPAGDWPLDYEQALLFNVGPDNWLEVSQIAILMFHYSGEWFDKQGLWSVRKAIEYVVTYWDRGCERHYRIVSAGTIDAGEIARRLGGNGDKDTAGFRVPTTSGDYSNRLSSEHSLHDLLRAGGFAPEHTTLTRPDNTPHGCISGLDRARRSAAKTKQAA